VAEGGCHFSQGCGFPAPSADIFNFQPMFNIGGFAVTKPMVLAVFSSLLILLFFWAAFRKPKLVPSRVQLIGEMGFLFVRDGISREIAGKKADKYAALLVTLFFSVWVMNLMAVIPVAQFPVTSRIAFPAALALVVWLVYMGVGFRRHGFLGYLKVLCWPSDVPGWVMVILVPIEFVSNIFFRPFTLAIRLFANMFAGHIIIVTFSVAAWYLLSPSIGALFGAVSFVMAILLTAFEVLIQGLQAYIFTALTATYLAGALEEAH
jgi:F-type H+-transporting ATPase subunit a